MATNGISVFDGDGHVFEDMAGISRHLPQNWSNSALVKTLGLFPGLDHLRHGLATLPPGTFIDPGPDGWVKFLDASDITGTVLYPTSALARGAHTGPRLRHRGHPGLQRLARRYLSEGLAYSGRRPDPHARPRRRGGRTAPPCYRVGYGRRYAAHPQASGPT